MIERCDQHKPVVGHRCDREATLRLRKGQYAELDTAIHDIAQNAGRSRVFEVYLCGGILFHKLAHLRRQLMQSNTINSSDLDPSTYLTDDTAQILLKPIISSQYIKCFSIKDLARRCQLDLAASANAF